jgi:hypothetical protein
LLGIQTRRRDVPDDSPDQGPKPDMSMPTIRRWSIFILEGDFRHDWKVERRTTFNEGAAKRRRSLSGMDI